jgi:Immunity protein 26
MTLQHPPTTRKERAAAKKVVVSAGEIFRVPLSESTMGYGQVLAETTEGTLIFVCLFDKSSSTGEDPPIGSILSSPIALVAQTFKVFIQLKKWPVIGKDALALQPSELPKFKVGTGGQMHVVSFDGTTLKPCVGDEASWLAYNGFTQCALLEKIYAQHFGLLKVDITYDEMKPDYLNRSRHLKP